MARTHTRPPLLQSTIARENVSRHDAPEIAGTFTAIDKLAEIWDALDTVRKTDDPLMTPEKRALTYRDAFQKATARATAEVRSAADKLMAAREGLRRESLGKAGLLAHYGNEAEIRAALRMMNPEQRDKAISTAAKTGDHAIIAAIFDAHPVTVGETTLPLGSIIDQFVSERAPDEAAQIANIGAALENLELSYQQFATSAEAMRDREGEDRGEAGNKAAREAEAKLGLALAAT